MNELKPELKPIRKFKVLYRISAYGKLSDWKEAEMSYEGSYSEPFKEITGPVFIGGLVRLVKQSMSPIMKTSITPETVAK